MTEIKDSIEIKTTAETVFEFFVHFEENFHAWHPDHVKCRWIGEPAREGSILYVAEYLHGKLHKFKFLMTEIVQNRRIEYLLLFPMSLICPKGSFVIESKGESCVFTATLSFRFAKFFLTVSNKQNGINCNWSSTRSFRFWALRSRYRGVWLI